jgi:hypothetical protein
MLCVLYKSFCKVWTSQTHAAVSFFFNQPDDGYILAVLIYPWWHKQPQETQGHIPENQDELLQ